MFNTNKDMNYIKDLKIIDNPDGCQYINTKELFVAKDDNLLNINVESKIDNKKYIVVEIIARLLELNGLEYLVFYSINYHKLNTTKEIIDYVNTKTNCHRNSISRAITQLHNKGILLKNYTNNTIKLNPKYDVNKVIDCNSVNTIVLNIK